MCYRVVLQSGLRVALCCVIAFAFWVMPADAFAEGQRASQAQPPEVQGAESEQARDALIKVLEDPKKRAVLIDLLKADQSNSDAAPQEETGNEAGASAVALPIPGASSLVSEKSPASRKSKSEDDKAEAEGTLSSQIGQKVEMVVRRGVAMSKLVITDFEGYTRLLRDVQQANYDRLWQALTIVLSVIVVGYSILFLMRRIFRHILVKILNWGEERGGLARATLLLTGVVLDAIGVLSAAAGASIFVVAMSFGELTPNSSSILDMSLSAFFVVEVSRVGLRFLFAPHRPKLRLVPLSDWEARYWQKHLMVAIGLFGFGVQLVAPLLQRSFSWSFGNSVRATFALMAVVYITAIIFGSRHRVREELRSYADLSIQSAFAKTLVKGLAAIWHWFAFIYVLSMYSIWINSPSTALEFIAFASAKSILIIAFCAALVISMNHIVEDGITLSDDVNRQLPSLQGHINTVVPSVFALARLVLVIGAIIGFFEVWGLGGFWGWATVGDGRALAAQMLSAFLITVVGFIVWLVAMSWIDLRVGEGRGTSVSARKRTLYKLFGSALTIVLVVMVGLIVLSELGVQIAPLIAGAGVLGLAISFGSQKLVQDVITGAFIQLENAMNEGDFVTVAGVGGTVERLTLRSVRLRDLNGTSHIIPFSSVDSVANSMKDYAYHVAVIGVSYDTKVEDAKAAMHEAFDRLSKAPEGAVIIGELEMQGVINFGPSSVDLRARIKTVPGSQWAIGRAFNERVKEVFDERQIEIPFPQVTYHIGSSSEIDEPKTKLAQSVTKGSSPVSPRGVERKGESGTAMADDDGDGEAT